MAGKRSETRKRVFWCAETNDVHTIKTWKVGVRISAHYCGDILKYLPGSFTLVTISFLFMWSGRHLVFSFFGAGGLSILSWFNSSFFCVFSGTLFLSCWWWQCAPVEEGFYEHLDFICAASWTLGMRYVQRGHDLPHLSFSGNESYLELKAENCLLWKIQTLIFLSSYSCAVLPFWRLMVVT